MKKLFLLLMCISVVYVSNGQSRARRATASSTPSAVSLGVELGVPVGENGKVYSMIIGGSLQYEAMPSSDLGITVSAGYLQYPVKSKYGGGSVGFVPLLGGVKYYFSPMAYFHAQLGAAVGTAKGQGTSFAYTPGLGLKFSRNFDGELKYVGISNKGGTIDNVLLRLAYTF